MGEIYIEMTIRNDEKIIKGHIDYFDPKDADNITEDKEIIIHNPTTGQNEKCKVTKKMLTKHGNTGKEVVMVAFKSK